MKLQLLLHEWDHKMGNQIQLPQHQSKVGVTAVQKIMVCDRMLTSN